jgi:hypothetical protein
MNVIVKADGKLATRDREPQPTSLLEVITRAAKDPDIDVGKMERLVELSRSIKRDEAEAAFNAAMAACQEAMRPISADATNPQTRSKYASYGKLDKVLRPIYTRHGFSITFSDGETTKPEHVRVTALVRHSAGHKETHWKDMPADGKGAKGGDVMTKTHAAGAAQQYGMRYLLKGIFNVAIGEDDTDGNPPDSIETLTQEQIDNIQALITEVKADVPKMLHLWRVKALKDIPRVNYHTVMDLLEAKRR